MKKIASRSAEEGIREAYARDGFIISPEVFPRTFCEELKVEALSMMRSYAGQTATVMVGVSVVSARFRELTADPRILRLISPLLSEGIMFLSDKFVFKSSEKSFATPWHVDESYWSGTRPKLSVWIALDHARIDNGCLKVVRGGHLQNWAHSASEGADTNHEFQSRITRSAWASADEIPCEVDQGGMIVFSDRLPHGSYPNVSGEERYALILTYHAPAPDEPFDLNFPARHVIQLPIGASALVTDPMSFITTASESEMHHE